MGEDDNSDLLDQLDTNDNVARKHSSLPSEELSTSQQVQRDSMWNSVKPSNTTQIPRFVVITHNNQTIDPDHPLAPSQSPPIKPTGQFQNNITDPTFLALPSHEVTETYRAKRPKASDCQKSPALPLQKSGSGKTSEGSASATINLDSIPLRTDDKECNTTLSHAKAQVDK